MRPVFFLLLLFGGASACTSIIVGKEATDDGSHYICRTADTVFSNWTLNLYYHPPRNETHTFKSITNNFTTELPAPGLWYVALPDYRTMLPGVDPAFEENGFNSAGVSLSSTETIYSNAATVEADPLNTDTGIIEDDIASIILPQATSARQGAQLLGKYIEEYGSGEGFGCSFADMKEIWYLENAGGHLWLAQRVPHDSVFVSANQGRFQEVDLEDKDNVMSSPGLLDFAIKKKLYDPKSGKPFNWLTAFMQNVEEDSTYNYPRVAWLQTDYVKNTSVEDGPYFPVFQKPATPLSLAEIMQGLRWHYDGSPHDPYLNQNPKEPWRPIAVLRTAMGHVTRTRPDADLPDGLTIINYVAMSMPHLAPFIPIYKGLPGDALPAAMTAANGSAPDGISLFWKARRLHALVFQDWPKVGPRAAQAIAAWEQDVEERQRPAMERRYIRLWKEGNEQRATKILVDFTRTVVAQAGQLLEELAVQAALGLGENGVPPDDVLVPLLFNATEVYGFHGA